MKKLILTLFLIFYSIIGVSQDKLCKDIVILTKAGITNATILTNFVDNAEKICSIDVESLVYLKTNAVDDGIILHLLKKPVRLPKSKVVAIPRIIKNRITDGDINPESYDFFFYYYLLPRALKYSEKTQNN